MSDKPNDGGPAFPFQCQGATTGPEIYYGMSLRDWLAGQALAGWVACPSTDGKHSAAAQYCYQLADAMLAERAKGGAE
jgi:hypothetical protein